MKRWKEPLVLCKCLFVNVEECLLLGVSPHQTIATTIKICSGSPDSGNLPQAYVLGNGVIGDPSNSTTLYGANVNVENGKTVMKLTKPYSKNDFVLLSEAK
jgi:hypothetical protein